MNYDQLTPLTSAPNTYSPSTACTMHTSFFIFKSFFYENFVKLVDCMLCHKLSSNTIIDFEKGETFVTRLLASTSSDQIKHDSH